MFFGSRTKPLPKKTYRRPVAQPPMEEPRNKDWKQMHAELEGRNALFAAAYEQLIGYVDDDAVRFRLAATDAFVEKAQHRLTTRASRLATTGVLTSILALLLLIAAGTTIYFAKPPVVSNPYSLTVFILRSLSVGGFIGGACYLLVSLSRALLHEATVLLTRRHSLRFGRLSVYLHDGQLDPDALLKTFRWSDEVGSAFLDLHADSVKGGPAAIVAQVPPILEGAAKVVDAARRGSSPRSS